MTVNECFVCPYCGEAKVALVAANPLMSDIRVDTLECNKCFTQWRLYSKVSEMQIEITSMPEKQENNVEHNEEN